MDLWWGGFFLGFFFILNNKNDKENQDTWLKKASEKIPGVLTADKGGFVLSFLDYSDSTCYSLISFTMQILHVIPNLISKSYTSLLQIPRDYH